MDDAAAHLIINHRLLGIAAIALKALFLEPQLGGQHAINEGTQSPTAGKLRRVVSGSALKNNFNFPVTNAAQVVFDGAVHEFQFLYKIIREARGHPLVVENSKSFAKQAFSLYDALTT